MLPAGKYVVEVVVPPGYELVKEEDKNILIGDNYIAPATQQFGALGQHLHPARPGRSQRACYNANNAQNPTQTLGRTSLPESRGRHGQRRDLLALRGRSAHRSGLHQPVPAVRRSSAVRRSDAQPLRPQGSDAGRPDVGAGEVLGLHLDARRRALHRRDHGRLHLGVRSVLAAVRREILPGRSAGLHQGLDRNRNLPRVCRPLGRLQRPDLLDLGSQPAQSDRLCAAP